MEHLYLNGYIKRDKIWQALHYAQIHGHLNGVEEREVKAFLQGFEEVATERHMEFQDRIDHREVRKIIEIMSRDHTDIVNERDLRTIENILLDEDFEF